MPLQGLVPWIQPLFDCSLSLTSNLEPTLGILKDNKEQIKKSEILVQDCKSSQEWQWCQISLWFLPSASCQSGLEEEPEPLWSPTLVAQSAEDHVESCYSRIVSNMLSMMINSLQIGVTLNSWHCDLLLQLWSNYSMCRFVKRYLTKRLFVWSFLSPPSLPSSHFFPSSLLPSLPPSCLPASFSNQ